MGVAGIESIGIDNCDYYVKQRDYETTIAARYTWIVFSIAVAVAACVVGLIIAIAIKEWGATAAASIGTVATGSAVKFILDQREEHRTRATDWAGKIEAECGDA